MLDASRWTNPTIFITLAAVMLLTIRWTMKTDYDTWLDQQSGWTLFLAKLIEGNCVFISICLAFYLAGQLIKLLL